jgi:hypothetical protein
VRGPKSEDFFTGDPGGYVEKALETSISLHRGFAEESRRGSYTGDFERRKRILGVWIFFSRKLYEVNLEGWLLYWGPRNIRQVRHWKWASVSIETRFWETWRDVLFL